MITGFNTDIQFEGVTYHVQTEDKGLQTPLILSLVYVGGTVIASKRTFYQDLVEQGFDEQALTERLQRQHKLICAAIRAGRVADLKKMSGTSGAARAASGVKVRQPAEPAEPVTPPEPRKQTAPAANGGPPPAPDPIPEPAPIVFPSLEILPPGEVERPEARAGAEQPPADLFGGDLPLEDELRLSLFDDEGDFRAGQLATIKIHVGYGGYTLKDVAGAAVTVKILGTTFRPLLLSAMTDAEGMAVVRALLPIFTSGRAAIIIRAVAGDESAELRRIILHS